MKVLVYGISLYVIAFILHLIIWRIRIPKRQTKALLLIFFPTLLAGLFFLFKGFSSVHSINLSQNNNLWECIHISLLYIPLTLAYIITYSAIEADSPSLLMVLAISKAGQRGLNKNDFYNSMTDDLLVKPRIIDLLRDKMAYMDGNKLRLTRKGLIFVHIFISYRNLLKARKGG